MRVALISVSSSDSWIEMFYDDSSFRMVEDVKTALQFHGVGLVVIVTIVPIGQNLIKSGEFAQIMFASLCVYSQRHKLQSPVGGTVALLNVAFLFPSVGTRNLTAYVEHLLG